MLWVGGLRTRGPEPCLLSWPSRDAQLVLGQALSSLWLLVQKGPLGVFLHLFIRRRRAKFKRRKP